MSSVQCSASSRFESTRSAPGCNSGWPSNSRWPSPPTVQSWVLAASVSNNSVLPERGAARMINGRPRAWPPTRRRRTGALTGQTTRKTRPSSTLNAATRLLRTTIPRDSSRAFSRRLSRSAAKRSQALESVPCRAYSWRQSRQNASSSVCSTASRSSSAASLESVTSSARRSSSSNSTSAGCITADSAVRSDSGIASSDGSNFSSRMPKLGSFARETKFQNAALPVVSATRWMRG